MGKWTKQEMKRTQWPGMWQQMVASCKAPPSIRHRLQRASTMRGRARSLPASWHSAYHL